MKSRTPKQIEASRVNGARSKGPVTAAGKAACRRNALKHGIFAEVVLVRGTDLAEDEREFASLAREFRVSLQPQGPLEVMLVEQIVSLQWRLRRVLKVEAGEVVLSVTQGRQLAKKDDQDGRWQEWSEAQDEVLKMKKSVVGLTTLRERLLEARDYIAAGDLWRGHAHLRSSFGGRENRFSEVLSGYFRRTEAFFDLPEVNDGDGIRRNLETGREELDRRKAVAHKDALAFVDKELKLIDKEIADFAGEEEQAVPVEAVAALLPSREVLDRVVGYEMKLNRQLHRAMAQLERLQRIRNGETVPAPICLV